MDWAKLPWKSSEYAAIALINEQNHLAQQKRANYFLQRRLQAFLFAPNSNGHFLVRHSTNTLLPRMSGWRCCLPMMAASITSAGRFSPLGPRADLPLIEVKIRGPHGAGQYLRRALSACFLDFDHYRCRVHFRLSLSAGCGNVIYARTQSINPNC